MNTIEYTSLATQNDSNELTPAITFRSLVTPPAPTTLLTLAEYMATLLDDTQRATREALVVSPCPPSGRGSDHNTVRAPKAA